MSSVDDMTTGSTGATATHASNPARRSRRARTPLIKPAIVQDAIAVSDSIGDGMAGVGMGRAAP